MKHENEKVALQAVEFWSTVCEEEIELAIEAQEVRNLAIWDHSLVIITYSFLSLSLSLSLQAEDMGEVAERQSYNFARASVPQLVPVLLWLLTKKDEDDDEDEWNVSMSAATSLGLLANCIDDNIVQPVIQFVEQNIRSPDWKFREAAVMAFGSILEGPNTAILNPLAQTVSLF